ncbi:MAG: glycosyltransferase family 4 protein [Spirochaetaceae bacterium]|jgi:glycosyltransferase involved in cell wall biosynthesis|nr:glycosyltransferase family 4 protein [Spirochaetaceae bacterium]
MKMAIDCRVLGSSGIGTFLKGVLPYFFKTGISFLIITNKKNYNFIYDLSQKNAAEENCLQRPEREFFIWNEKPFSLSEICKPPAALIKKINSCNVYWSPFFNIPRGIKISVYTTIHDIIFPDFPGITSRAGLAARMFFFNRCFKLSARVFTVSGFSASRIRFYSQNINRNLKIVVCGTAADEGVRSGGVVGNIKKTKTILFVGNIKKHKGLFTLIKAFQNAKKQGLTHKLIIAGEKENFRTKDARVLAALKDSGDDIVFTGFLGEEELSVLYKEAALLVQPSLYEGFGLPPMEAMLHGTLALISDIPVFKEVYAGFPVHFFQAGNEKKLEEQLVSLLRNKEPQTVVLTQAQKEKYTFQKTSLRILGEIT